MNGGGWGVYSVPGGALVLTVLVVVLVGGWKLVKTIWVALSH